MKTFEEYFKEKEPNLLHNMKQFKFWEYINKLNSGYIDYLKKQGQSLPINSVSQQRELLNALADNFNESTHTYIGEPMIEETLKAFNCG